MSIQNKLFRNLLSSVENIEEYKSLKEHINKTFSKFSGNKLNATKLDKFSSDLFGANNPNVIPGILSADTSLSVFNDAKSILKNNFSEYMLHIIDDSLPVSDNTGNEWVTSVFCFFIPLYKNTYYDKHGDKLNVHYNLGIYVHLEHEMGKVKIMFNIKLCRETQFENNLMYYGERPITSLLEDEKFECFYFYNNKERVYCKNNIKDVQRHDFFNQLFDEQDLRTLKNRNDGIYETLNYCNIVLKRNSDIFDTFDVEKVVANFYFNDRVTCYLHEKIKS